MPCRALVALIVMLSSTETFSAVPQDTYRGLYLYDAKMAFLKAGELRLDLSREGDTYEVVGQFKTSRAMSIYYTFNGVFAAVGKWRPFGGPVTTAYMSLTTDNDRDLKIVLNYAQNARVLDGENDEFESVERPGGIDLISALFFSPTCYQGGLVHDGEDAYRLTLNSERSRTLNGGRRYFKGEVISCDYAVRDHKNRKRRVIVSMADVNGIQVAVQVRAKIPLLPDAVFRLRMPAREPQLARSN